VVIRVPAAVVVMLGLMTSVIVSMGGSVGSRLHVLLRFLAVFGLPTWEGQVSPTDHACFMG
jgi:hypothetical protein